MEMEEKKSGMYTFNQTFKIEGKVIERTFVKKSKKVSQFQDGNKMLSFL